MSYQALLFCQDEKTVRTVTQVLSELDFQVDSCAETFAAVKKLTSQPFEAVVVDCQSEENASLLLKTARNSASNQAALMVALVEGQAGVAAAFRIGANLVLTKPIAVEQARGTLRVARGLLRKNSAVASAPTSAPIAPPTVPVVSPTKPVNTLTAATVKPAPTPVRAPVPPARIAPPSVPVAARPIPPGFPTTPRVAPVQPSTLLESTASSNLESEAEFQPRPDAASAGLLEALEFKAFEPAQSKPTAPNSTGPGPSEVVSVSELRTGANEAVRVALAPKSPISSQEFGAGFGAAAAPAKELPKPQTAAMPAEVADLFEAPVFGQASTTHTSHEPTTDEPEVEFRVAPAARASKTPLMAALGLVVLAAVLYFGWSQMHKPAATTTPTAGPLQPPPPDFGASDTSQTAAPAPAHTTPPVNADADAAQTSSEPVNRFSRQNRAVAEDHVTTPIAVVTPRPATALVPSQVSHQAPIQVKTQLERTRQTTLGSSQDAAEAPSITNLGAIAKPEALNAITRATTTALPAAPAQRISQGVSDGLLLKRVQPTYPQQALQMHIQGTVSLQATIAKDGSVRNVKVISGPATLARAASDAVRQWKYRPYTLNGDPIEIQTEININFVPPR